MRLRIGSLVRAGLFAFCSVALLGCGKGNDNQAASKGQVVARIGDQVITISELDNEFRLANVPVDRQKDPETLKKMLTELVARKYLFSQAMAAKLDREPGVLLELLRSRETVLANAIVARNVTAKVSSVGQADLNRYISSNPGRFASRQLLDLEQITFAINADTQSVVDSAKGKNSLDEVDQQLTAMSVPHVRGTATVGSSELPEDLAAQIRTRKPGEVLFYRAGANGVFLVAKSEAVRPLGGEAAQNLARQALRTDLFKAELGAASVAASLEATFEGDYAKIMSQKAPEAGGSK